MKKWNQSSKCQNFEPKQKVTLTTVDAPFRNCYQFSADGQDMTKLEYSFEILDLDPLMWPFEHKIRTAIEEGAEMMVENIKNLIGDEV